MEPLVDVVTAYPVHRVLEAVEHLIRRHAIERWSKRRARAFFEAFCTALAAGGIAQEDLERTLETLLSSEVNSETMFDAYRSVCLTKSRVVGPRVIALLTAQLVAAHTTANDNQELIFAAAEVLSDAEFDAFVEFVGEHATDKREHKSAELQWADMRIEVRHESHTLRWPHQEMSLGPLDLANEVGTWASKLKQIGLVSDEVRELQRAYEEDTEAHVDIPGVDRRLTWWLTLSSVALELAELAAKAAPRKA